MRKSVLLAPIIEIELPSPAFFHRRLQVLVLIGVAIEVNACCSLLFAGVDQCNQVRALMAALVSTICSSLLVLRRHHHHTLVHTVTPSVDPLCAQHPLFTPSVHTASSACASASSVQTGAARVGAH